MDEDLLRNILNQYQQSFTAKTYGDENQEIDILMQVFGITPALKQENRQYWGRELGMCWQRLVATLCQQTRSDYAPPYRIERDELCDLIVGNLAIDTKYRIGSGDAGTLKKFKSYAQQLKKASLQPVLLILRTDNLPAAINAVQAGGWQIYTGVNTLNFLQELTGFDLQNWLKGLGESYHIDRPMD